MGCLFFLFCYQEEMLKIVYSLEKIHMHLLSREMIKNFIFLNLRRQDL